jgi:hypothetical protein
MSILREVADAWGRMLYWGAPTMPYAFAIIVLGFASLIAVCIPGLLALGRWMFG